MEALEKLRAKIAGFPGYDGDSERRRSDQFVRSYLGEALTELGLRCKLTPDLQSRLDALVLRAEFADPRTFAAHSAVGAQTGGNDDGAVAQADAATVDLADRAASIDPVSASEYFNEVSASLDQRLAAIRAASLR